MTRDDYKAALQSKGFKFEKTILSYPRRRGDEDIYTNKPKYKYTFRVSRVFEDDPRYGLYVGVGDQFRYLDNLVKHDVDAEDWGEKSLPMWTGDNFKKLVEYL